MDVVVGMEGGMMRVSYLLKILLSGSEKAFRFALTDPLDMRILLLGQRRVATAAVTGAELTERARFPAALMNSGCNGESMLIEDSVAVAESWVKYSAYTFRAAPMTSR